MKMSSESTKTSYVLVESQGEAVLGVHRHTRTFATFPGHTKTIRGYRGMRRSGLLPVWGGGKLLLADGKESPQYVDSQ